MNHIKTFKLFESEIKRDFDEWLKDPKAPREALKYQFEFPAKKVYNINEDRWNPDAIANFLRIERGNNIYQQIATDLSSNYSSTSFDEDDDDESSGVSLTEREIKSNFSEFFEEWIKQEYEDKMDQFYRMYDLDFDETELNIEDFESIKDDFNEYGLEKYYTAKEYGYDFSLLNMRIDDLEGSNIIRGSFESTRTLSEDEIESVKDYITGQCSDGWGEGFSQNEEKEVIHDLSFFVSIKPWWNEGYPSWYLNITPIEN